MESNFQTFIKKSGLKEEPKAKPKFCVEYLLLKHKKLVDLVFVYTYLMYRFEKWNFLIVKHFRDITKVISLPYYYKNKIRLSFDFSSALSCI